MATPYGKKVKITMSNTDTSNACISCGTPSLDPDYVQTKCDRCESRITVGWGFSLEAIHEIALQEYNIRKSVGFSVETLLFHYAQTSIALAQKSEDANALARQSIDAGDYRLEDLWSELWDALERRFDRDEVWGQIVEAVEGAPDLRHEFVDGSIKLTFSFNGLEIPTGLDRDEREEAIIEAYTNEYGLNPEDADETEVEED